MLCPACRFPAQEDDAACRQCGFNLEAVDHHFGIPPVLERPITDLADVLSRGESSKIAHAARLMEQRFPQLSLAIVLAPVPAGIPPATWVFWLFNRGSLFSPVEKGGSNHGILLLADTVHDQAFLVIGYGLEPFIPDAILRDCLSETASMLRAKKSAAAILNGIAKLEHHLTQICESIPASFGYSEDGSWFESGKSPAFSSSPHRPTQDLF